MQTVAWYIAVQKKSLKSAEDINESVTWNQQIFQAIIIINWPLEHESYFLFFTFPSMWWKLIHKLVLH